MLKYLFIKIYIEGGNEHMRYTRSNNTGMRKALIVQQESGGVVSRSYSLMRVVRGPWANN